MNWLIAGIIAPIPIFHLWLHALLPTWRKMPLLCYAWGLLLWIGSFLLFEKAESISPVLFNPSTFTRSIGFFLIGLGTLSILSSILTLGPKRFFVWAVLRPDSVPRVHIRGGPFRFIPHPAYVGYLFIALGNLLIAGKLYLAPVFVFLLILTPIVIMLEEEELKKRVG